MIVPGGYNTNDILTTDELKHALWILRHGSDAEEGYFEDECIAEVGFAFEKAVGDV